MHRYSPVRNQRSKGIKIKHVLRICFLIAVCCWLIFQIKRSRYERGDLESVDAKSLSSNTVDEVVKLGRKDLQPKKTETREEDDEEEHEIDEGKDDEIDETEQYKFDDEEDTVNEREEEDGQSQTANAAREEHYKADDASSAVSHEHDDQTLDNSKFLEMAFSAHEIYQGASLNATVKIQETGSVSANITSDQSQYDSDSTRLEEESETSLKSANMSAIIETQAMLTNKENNSGSSETMAETEDDTDEVQHDAIDSTDFIHLEDLDALDNSEDTVAE